MSNKKLKLNIITDYDKNTGSTRIRVYNLLTELKKYFDLVEINSNSQDIDVVVFQKTNNLKDLLKFRMHNVFTCYDIDDYFDNIFDMVKYVDLVIVSTEYLKQKLLKYNKNIIVIPNSLDIDNYDIPLVSHKNDTDFGWYGWYHNSSVLDEIGIRNDVITVTEQGQVFYDTATIDEVLQKFSYILIPQKKSEHTLCKTHCRFLKALYLGIPTIVSDMPEYLNLAKLLDYPDEYIVDNLYDFKILIDNIKNKKIILPELDFNQIRKKILDNFSKYSIAKLFVEKVVNIYENKNIFVMFIKTCALLYKLYSRKLFAIELSERNIRIFLLGAKIRIKNCCISETLVAVRERERENLS